MTFSKRCSWSSSNNPWVRRSHFQPPTAPALVDLEGSNPTTAGFIYPDTFYTNLGKFHSPIYRPDSLGLTDARQTIVQYYERHGIQCRSDQICLGNGTSELYSYLLLLLCDPGDCILVPRPGYPLVEILANLHQVNCIPYELFYESGWSIDQGSILELLSGKTDHHGQIRAIFLISPHHPSGHCLSRSELKWLDTLCLQHNLSVVVDEVFSEFSLHSQQLHSSIQELPSVLSFALSGLSKAAALPQLKLSWCVCSGPPGQRDETIKRLATLSDNYLSTNQSVQLALPYIMSELPTMSRRIRQHARSNFLVMQQRLKETPIRLLDCEAGWVAILHMPQLDPNQGNPANGGISNLSEGDLGTAWALYFLEQHHVLIQPGHLYDLDGPYLVVSLLTPAGTLHTGLDRIIYGVEQLLCNI